MKMQNLISYARYGLLAENTCQREGNRAVHASMLVTIPGQLSSFAERTKMEYEKNDSNKKARNYGKKVMTQIRWLCEINWRAWAAAVYMANESK